MSVRDTVVAVCIALLLIGGAGLVIEGLGRRLDGMPIRSEQMAGSWEGRKVANVIAAERLDWQGEAGREMVLHFEPNGAWFVLIVQNGEATAAIPGHMVRTLIFEK